MILPFEIIYLHQFRGFSTATAGLVLAAILRCGHRGNTSLGSHARPFRPKSILIAANLASASLVVLVGLGLALRGVDARAGAETDTDKSRN